MKLLITMLLGALIGTATALLVAPMLGNSLTFLIGIALAAVYGVLLARTVYRQPGQQQHGEQATS
jgi:uncharacterized membrane protein YeaQ/YmgE (transglycosylase-associated protein family)